VAADEAVAKGELPATLVNEAVSRQTAFNKAYREGLSTIPQKPPEGMRFIQPGSGPASRPAPSSASGVRCSREPAPVLRGAINWSGDVLFKARVATRAGVVEAVDFDVTSPASASPSVVDYFRGAILSALAAYECGGDGVFEREFRFKVE